MMMKAIYIKPTIQLIALEDLCSNGLTAASVETKDGTHVDHFDVVEEDTSKDKYKWDKSSWGGD